MHPENGVIERYRVHPDSLQRAIRLTFARDSDKGTGPKVDAIFEDLPLAELEKRVKALIENAR